MSTRGWAAIAAGAVLVLAGCGRGGEEPKSTPWMDDGALMEIAYERCSELIAKGDTSFEMPKCLQDFSAGYRDAAAKIDAGKPTNVGGGSIARLAGVVEAELDAGMHD